MDIYVSASPHIRGDASVRRIMLDVILALLPACAVGIYMFGWNALLLICTSVVAAVLTEYALTKMMKLPNSVGDLSAVVTGIFLAMNLPASAPWWVAAVGSIFAIAVVKMAFGGIGCNFMNPALAGRALLMACWPAIMTTWQNPNMVTDAVSTATPLTLMKSGTIPPLMDLFLGKTGGCIGEVSALALLIGAAYLLYRGVINLRIPLSYIGTVFIITLFISGFDAVYSLAQVLAGGLILGAFFMANDYTTSPVTAVGQIIMGIGCGVLTVIIRQLGGYPEGVSYSILLMNLTVPLIERGTRPRVLGEKKTGFFQRFKKEEKKNA